MRFESVSSEILIVSDGGRTVEIRSHDPQTLLLIRRHAEANGKVVFPVPTESLEPRPQPVSDTPSLRQDVAPVGNTGKEPPLDLPKMDYNLPV